jgi:diadenosine hexaphosphate hydrolase (ATP-forming)
MLRAYPVNPDWTHAGGIVYRPRAAGHQLLLVRARPEPHDWVFPKGHIEPGESPHECARREVREEAGVDAEPLLFLDEDRFTKPNGKDVHVALFLMEYVREAPAEETRERRWCSVAEALALVHFESGRSAIRAAETSLTQQDP